MARDSRVEYPSALVDAANKLGVSLGEGAQFDAADAIRDLGAQFHGESIYDGPSEGRFTIHSFSSPNPLSLVDCIARGEAFAQGDEAFSEAGAEFGGLFSKLKRSVSKVGKGAWHGVKSVAKNPVFQAVLPVGAIAVHTTDRGLGGKGVIKGKLGQAVDAGTAVVMPKATAAVAAFAVPKSGLAASLSSADQLVRKARAAAPEIARDAQKVINNTKALAALGHADAQRGVAAIAAAQKIRDVRKVPPNQPAVPAHPAEQSFIQMHSQPQVQALAKKTIATKSGAGKPHWWTKVLGWIGLQPKHA